MILVILVLAIITWVVGHIVYDKSSNETVYGPAEVVWNLGMIISIICLIAISILIFLVSGSFVIDEKIAMYQEENAKIEEQIAAVVEQYQQYETDIFQSVAPESAVTLVAMYPELKSDSLVQTQIEVYMDNNEIIKQLKTEKIDASVLRWWLYFGG